MYFSQSAEQRSNATALATNCTYYLYNNLRQLTKTGEVSRGSSDLNPNVFCNSNKYEDYYYNNRTNESIYTYSTSHNVDLGNEKRFVTENVKNRISVIAWQDKTIYHPASGAPSVDKIYTFFSYDELGNVKAILQRYVIDNEDNSYIMNKTIHYDYDLISGNVKKVWYQKNEPDQFVHRYIYDSANRIKTVETSHCGKVWNRDALYKYYLHGPLARVVLGNELVQATDDYAYTINGWLKSINSIELSTPIAINPNDNSNTSATTIPQDVYSLTLHYHYKDYTPICPLLRDIDERSNQFSKLTYHVEGTTIGLFNGNIAGMTSEIYSNSTGGGLTTFANLSPQKLRFKYQYDQLNRIKRMSGTMGHLSSQYAATDYTYDANGNILILNRKHNVVYFDKLTYNYTQGANKLQQVNEAYPQPYLDANDFTNEHSGAKYSQVRTLNVAKCGHRM